jgi:amino acid transporter
MSAPGDDVDLASLASSSNRSNTSNHLEDVSPMPSPRSSLSQLSNTSFSYNDMLFPLTVSAEDPSGHARLEKIKTVTYWSGLSLVVGLQIGSGIFSSPALVNRNAGSVGMSLIVWVVAGCLAWTGACTFFSYYFPPKTGVNLIASYAELGSAIPLNGGAYAYLRHIFGPLWAFLFSWTAIVALKPGSAAIIAIIFAEYVDRILFFSLQPNDTTPLWADKLVAVLCIWIISALNAMGTKWGTIINNIFTLLKLLALVAIAIIGIVVLGIFTCYGSNDSYGSWRR